MSSDRPNLLFVFSDQQRWDSLGCYGNTVVNTPNLDAFRAQGLRLDCAISNTPVCTPYRAALMTGKYAFTTGVVTNGIYPAPGAHTYFAEAFRAAGYRCGYSGKWHLGERVDLDPGPARLGFDDYWATNFSSHNYYHACYARSANEFVETDCDFSPRLETNSAIDFIARQDDSQPWFCCLSWGPPHSPYPPPPAYDHYQGCPLPPNVPEGVSREWAAEYVPMYYGLVEGLDVQFGRLMEALEVTGMAANTIVVFTSDHGDCLGSHGVTFKRWPYRDSAQVPFLIRWPGEIPAGGALSMPFGAPDIFPTLAGLAGVTAPTDVDGGNFADALRGDPGAVRADVTYLDMRHAYVDWPGWRAIRTPRYNYARTSAGPWLLFDLEADPWETRNLVDEEPELRDDLDARLLAEMARLGDSWHAWHHAGDWRHWPRLQHQVLDGPWPARPTS